MAAQKNRLATYLGAILLSASMSSRAAWAAETLHFVSTEYPPYTSGTMAKGGVITEIATEAFKRAGYTIHVDVLPWSRALAYGKAGSDAEGKTIDGIVGVWRNPAREQWFVFSDPLPSNQIGFYKRADSTITFKSLADLKSYRIGIVLDYANPKVFDDAKLNTDAVSNDEINIRKLVHGRVDLILVDKGVAQYILETRLPQYKGQVGWLDPPIDTLPLYIAFSKKAGVNDKTLSALNHALKEMEKDGTIGRLVGQGGYLGR